MTQLLQMIEQYVESHICDFHTVRLKKLEELKLKKLIKRKNPYLYRAKNLNTPQDIVEAITSAYMSSAEETMFGDWLEKLAIFVASNTYGAHKSVAEGIDFEMDKDGIHYIVSVKSGPNWSNSSSKKKLIENIAKAKRIYRTSGNHNRCEAIEGCCYGVEKSPEKDTHTKLCGQDFWSFISGIPTMYTDIIEPLGAKAKSQNEEYEKEYAKLITRLSREFANEFCLEDGTLDWNKVVELNSASVSIDILP